MRRRSLAANKKRTATVANRETAQYEDDMGNPTDDQIPTFTEHQHWLKVSPTSPVRFVAAPFFPAPPSGTTWDDASQPSEWQPEGEVK